MGGLQDLLRAALTLVILASCAVPASSQTLPPLPSTNPSAPPELPSTTSASVETRLLNLEEQNRLLMEQNRRLAEQLEALTGQYRAINERLSPPSGGTGADISTEGGAGARDNPAGTGPAGPSSGLRDLEAAEEDVTTEGGAGARDNPAGAEEKKPEKPKFPLIANFGPGFEFMTEDEEFRLQFHNETQIEYRDFDHTGQGTVHDGFFMPRQIWWFGGWMTKPIEYYTAFQKGLGSVSVRDAFINLHYDDRLMVKAGRYKPPFTYEFYAISNQDLMQPERSLFALNFGDNRELGAMIWGQLFEDRLDYAAGVFNGPRNSFEDLNDSKDVAAYIHALPFGKSERWEFLKNFGVGGSVDFGNQGQPAFPQALRTAVSASSSNGSSTAAPAFLIFNDGVQENGDRDLWNLHATYFYKGLSILAEWDSGFADYTRGVLGSPRVRVPIEGYYIAAGYFLTGETVSRRTQVQVLHPFSLKPGERGLGAFELQARYSALNLGRQVFAGGLADPRLWSNSAQTFETGVNWYLNQYTKLYVEWHHTDFGDPVIYRRGIFHQSSNMFWIRLQIYF